MVSHRFRRRGTKTCASALSSPSTLVPPSTTSALAPPMLTALLPNIGSGSAHWAQEAQQPYRQPGWRQPPSIGHGLNSNKMALITSDCDTMRIHDHQMALGWTDCVRQVFRGSWLPFV